MVPRSLFKALETMNTYIGVWIDRQFVLINYLVDRVTGGGSVDSLSNGKRGAYRQVGCMLCWAPFSL